MYGQHSKSQSQHQSQPRLIRRREVERLTGLCRSAIYLHIARGVFPKPVPIANRAVAWVEAEVTAWVRSRIAHRDAAEACHDPE